MALIQRCFGYDGGGDGVGPGIGNTFNWVTVSIALHHNCLLTVMSDQCFNEDDVDDERVEYGLFGRHRVIERIMLRCGWTAMFLGHRSLHGDSAARGLVHACSGTCQEGWTNVESPPTVVIGWY